MVETRTGYGYDAHRYGGNGPVTLGGVSIEHERGILGTSDADVAVHAICDALLGSVAAGDIGMHFPSDDPQWKGADSLVLLRQCTEHVDNAGFQVTSVDVTIIAQDLRVAPHRSSMRKRIAEAMKLDVGRVSVKATSTDGMGWIGEGEGLAAHAVATVQR